MPNKIYDKELVTKMKPRLLKLLQRLSWLNHVHEHRKWLWRAELVDQIIKTEAETTFDFLGHAVASGEVTHLCALWDKDNDSESLWKLVKDASSEDKSNPVLNHLLIHAGSVISDKKFISVKNYRDKWAHLLDETRYEKNNKTRLPNPPISEIDWLYDKIIEIADALFKLFGEHYDLKGFEKNAYREASILWKNAKFNIEDDFKYPSSQSSS